MHASRSVVRSVLMFGAVSVVLSACGGVEEAVDDAGTAVEQAVEEASSAVEQAATSDASDAGGEGDTATDADPAATTPESDGGAGEDASGGGDGSGEDAATSLAPVADGGGVGANGPAMLRAGRARLVVEVDVQAGATVPDAAIDHLLATIRDTSAIGEVVLAGGNEFASDDTSWTRDDLQAAVAANRTTASDDSQVSVHLLVVRGAHEADGQETNAIGLAYSASTMAYFPERVGGLIGLTGGSEGIARAVLVHELGHLYGLVNLTYTSPRDHEDPEHPGHSSSRDSVMYYAVETTLVGEIFGGGPPDTFDADDLADLEGLRTGELG